MDKFLDKKYKLVRQENYEKLLAQIDELIDSSQLNDVLLNSCEGVNKVMRKLLPKMKTETQLMKKSDNIYILNTRRRFLNQSLEFTLDEPFEEKMMNGEKTKSIIKFQNNTMIHSTQLSEPLMIIRNFFNDDMVTIMNYRDVVCTSWYKVISEKSVKNKN